MFHFSHLTDLVFLHLLATQKQKSQQFSHYLSCLTSTSCCLISAVLITRNSYSYGYLSLPKWCNQWSSALGSYDSPGYQIFWHKVLGKIRLRSL